MTNLELESLWNSILHLHLQCPDNFPSPNEDLKLKFFIIRGQIVHRRKVSKKLFFFDLQIDNNNTGERLEVIVKYDEVTLDQLVQLWRKVHVGHRVQINGFPEVVKISPGVHLFFHCTNIDVLEEYKGQNPVTPIAPKKMIKDAKANGNGNEKSEKLCKFWISTGKCQIGDDCPFLHTGGQIERIQWVNEVQN